MKRILIILLGTCFVIYLFPSCKKTGLSEINNSLLSTSSNVPPKVIAGPDQIIMLPVDSVELYGFAKDTDGTISSVVWSKRIGPYLYTIITPNQVETKVKNLVEGVYEFDLTATDNNGASASDIVQVTVKDMATPNESIFTNKVWDWNISSWKYIITVDLLEAINNGLFLDRLEKVFIKNSDLIYWEEVPDRFYPFYKWQSSLFGFEKYLYYDLDKVHNILVVTMTEFDGAALNPTLPVSLKLEFKN